MITPLVVLTWFIYGIVVLFLIILLFLLMLATFKDKDENILAAALFFFWVVPVSLVLGCAIYFSVKYIALLNLIK